MIKLADSAIDFYQPLQQRLPYASWLCSVPPGRHRLGQANPGFNGVPGEKMLMGLALFSMIDNKCDNELKR
jgi:hypothetical protein